MGESKRDGDGDTFQVYATRGSSPAGGRELIAVVWWAPGEDHPRVSLRRNAWEADGPAVVQYQREA